MGSPPASIAQTELSIGQSHLGPNQQLRLERPRSVRPSGSRSSTNTFLRAHYSDHLDLAMAFVMWTNLTEASKKSTLTMPQLEEY